MLGLRVRDTWERAVTDLAHDLAASDLAAIYPAPVPKVIAKALPALDVHATNFIGLSPFCVLASSGPDGSVDASPRGGNPGFIRVVSANEVMMPDRPGNNRIDSFQNILTGGGHVQLIFFVPGINDTLRVSGIGRLKAEPELLASMQEFGKPPRAVLSIAVSEVYFHCGKALMRSKLWDPATRVERGAFPTLGRIIAEQTRQIEVEAAETMMEEAYRTRLY